ncbi:hypothetical protein AB6A40_007728 [Gnathostoma spinigerum]|uniref:Uncharacterized protein n=1 Tax=Gnathostoma spinigerum TaxID=75299 RepID=A0ABD6EUR3_9BILA
MVSVRTSGLIIILVLIGVTSTFSDGGDYGLLQEKKHLFPIKFWRENRQQQYRLRLPDATKMLRALITLRRY